jgi:hypothetical protein
VYLPLRPLIRFDTLWLYMCARSAITLWVDVCALCCIVCGTVQ